jgi:hypothetical protein
VELPKRVGGVVLVPPIRDCRNDATVRVLMRSRTTTIMTTRVVETATEFLLWGCIVADSDSFGPVLFEAEASA